MFNLIFCTFNITKRNKICQVSQKYITAEQIFCYNIYNILISVKTASESIYLVITYCQKNMINGTWGKTL